MVHVAHQLLRKLHRGGKVDTNMEQMVFAEATTVLPLIASDAYHRGGWRKRIQRRFASIYKDSVNK